MKIDEKLRKYMLFAIGGIILFILIIFLLSRCSRTRVYGADEIPELKQWLIEVAKRYYQDNESYLPNIGYTITLSLDTLVQAERMRPLYEIIRDGEFCTGEITVTNHDGYILYIPKINCGDLYTSRTLRDVLLDESNIVTSGHGLYNVNNDFVFRGEIVNNHIWFANRLWLILRITEDNKVKIMETENRDLVVWDNRFNPTSDGRGGINTFIRNNVNSRIRDRMMNIYNNPNEFSYTDKAHLIPHNLCVGGRTETDSVYVNVECFEILENQLLGLITVYDFLQVSLDENCIITRNRSCVNYNFLARIQRPFWTITPDSESTFRTFRITNGVDLVNTSSSNASIKLTTKISGDLPIYRGDGSADNPFELITSPR